MSPSRRPIARCGQRGFSLTELMVSVVVMTLALGGVLTFFANFQRVSRQQEELRAMQTELRAASDQLTSGLRRAGYGAPTTLVSTWVSWVSGFDANPKIIQGATSADPDTISLAACTAKPIATVATTLPVGAGNNTVTLTSAVAGLDVDQLLDLGTNRVLIRFLGGHVVNSGFARVTAVSGDTVTIDTDPGTSGNQGFDTRTYFAGTPVCRVDVTTYAVDTSADTLTIDEHQGAPARAVFNGITDLQVTGGGNVFDLEIAGETERPDPTTGDPIPRRIGARITVRNQ
jgi:prepilin-type N-terminal cleavage/methylation domain-containing protein